MVIYSHLLLIL
jgi:hypothetical protein